MLHAFITVIYSVIYNKYDFDVFNGQDPLPKYYYRNMQMYHILFIYWDNFFWQFYQLYGQHKQF